jgi:hypothetical protein
LPPRVATLAGGADDGPPTGSDCEASRTRLWRLPFGEAGLETCLFLFWGDCRALAESLSSFWR